MDVTGKTAFVTGSARGIGRALCGRLAKAGCDIVGCDLRDDTQAAVKAEVEATGRTYHTLSGDLSIVEEAMAVTDEAVAIGFDILVNNAGIATSGVYDAVPFERWRKTIDLNLIGLMAITHRALPHLHARQSGFIVNMSSVAGVVGSPGMEAYSASKFGVNGFTRCLEYDLDGTTVGVTSIHPAMVKTRMIDGVARSKKTPEIEIDDVVDAIMDAIAKDRPQVFIPKSIRWPYDILTRIFPGVTRKQMRGDDMFGWRDADKGVPDA